MWMAKQGNRLYREVVESPALQIFKTHLDKTLNNFIYLDLF